MKKLFDTPLKVGNIRKLSDGNDILVVTSGIATEEALRASASLKKAGVSIKHIHLNTLKPIEENEISEHVQSVKYGVVSLENHLVNGGIGSIIAEIIAKFGISKKLIKLGLQDTFAHGGSKPYLMKYYGLDAYTLIKSITKLIDQKININESDLDNVRIEDVHSLSKEEAL